MTTDKTLYFAYGSNLDAKDLASWCTRKGRPHPLGESLGRAYLPDHKPAFTRRSEFRNGGVLDVVEHVGSFVPGVVFEVDRQALEVLDAKEGAPGAYRRKPCVVLKEDGAEVRAIAYEVVNKAPAHQPPSEDYFQVVLRGFKAHGLDHKVLSAAAAGKHGSPPLLFVYGTLKRGFARHDLLDGAAGYVCRGQVAGALFDLGAYPGMTVEGGKNAVHGEIYHVADGERLFAALDRVEGMTGFGVPGRLFRRPLVKVRGEWGDHLAWTYLLADDKGTPLPSGNWTDVRASSPDMTRNWIRCLRNEIVNGVYEESKGHAPEEWGGAGVVVTSKKQPPSPQDAFYPSPACVEHPDAQAAAWLMYALNNAFEGRIDSMSKYAFYGRLAESLSSHDSINGKPLLDMLDVADVMLRKMEEETF